MCLLLLSEIFFNIVKMNLLKNLLIILSIIVSTIATNAQNIPSNVPKNGLVGYWPFNGNANDESGNKMHGTGTPNFIVDRNSVTNSAISLPSISAIQLPSSVFQYEYGDTFSFSFWFTHEASRNARVFSTENSEGNFRIANGNGNGAYIIQFGGGLGGYLYDTLSSPTAWNHVVYVYKNRVVKLYVNGNLKKTFTHTSNASLNYGVQVAIGVKASSLNNDKWNGKFDDLGIWNRVLSATEVAGLYNGCTISSTDTIASCGAYTWTDGNTYTSSNNTATDTFVNAAGCDSVVTLNLTVIDIDRLISTQPEDQSVDINRSTSIIVTSGYDDVATYQWQLDDGAGFKDLNNAGQYSGVLTDTLLVSNVTLSNDGELFRCLVTVNDCSDTSETVLLTIGKVDVSERALTKDYAVYPNPTKGIIFISTKASLLGASYTVYSSSGALIRNGSITSEITTLDIQDLQEGIYFIQLGDNIQQSFKIIKQ
jgi:hypothetical protein